MDKYLQNLVLLASTKMVRDGCFEDLISVIHKLSKKEKVYLIFYATSTQLQLDPGRF